MPSDFEKVENLFVAGNHALAWLRKRGLNDALSPPYADPDSPASLEIYTLLASFPRAKRLVLGAVAARESLRRGEDVSLIEHMPDFVVDRLIKSRDHYGRADAGEFAELCRASERESSSGIELLIEMNFGKGLRKDTQFIIDLEKVRQAMIRRGYKTFRTFYSPPLLDYKMVAAPEVATAMQKLVENTIHRLPRRRRLKQEEK